MLTFYALDNVRRVQEHCGERKYPFQSGHLSVTHVPGELPWLKLNVLH